MSTQTDHELPEVSAAEVLSGLRSTAADGAERQRLILFAEILDFDDRQAAELKQWLREFIDDYRLSADRDELVTVCSATRKYIALLNPNEMHALASLFERPGRRPLPLLVKAEVAKMIVRKLVATIPLQEDCLPVLGLQLMGLINTHLDPELLSEQYHGVIVSNCILALVLLRSPQMAVVYRLLDERSDWKVRPSTGMMQEINGELAADKVPANWFRKLLLFRAAEITKQLEKLPLKEVSSTIETLNAFTSNVRAALHLEYLSVPELQERLKTLLTQLRVTYKSTKFNGVLIIEPVTDVGFLEAVAGKCNMSVAQALPLVKEYLIHAVQSMERCAIQQKAR